MASEALHRSLLPPPAPLLSAPSLLAVPCTQHVASLQRALNLLFVPSDLVNASSVYILITA